MPRVSSLGIYKSGDTCAPMWPSQLEQLRFGSLMKLPVGDMCR